MGGRDGGIQVDSERVTARSEPAERNAIIGRLGAPRQEQMLRILAVDGDPEGRRLPSLGTPGATHASGA